MSWLADIHPDEPAPLLKLYGGRRATLGFIFMLATTIPIEIDEDWWQVYLATKWWN